MTSAPLSDHPRVRAALLFFRDDAATGGSFRVGELIARHVPQTELLVDCVFAYGGPGPLAASGVPCHFLGADGPADALGWIRARTLIDRISPDILHFVDPVFWLNVALTGLKIPRILHIHGPLDAAGLPLRDRVLWSLSARAANVNLCITQGMREELLRAKWVTGRSCSVIYNAIDCTHFENLPERNEARDLLRLPRDAFILGMICRLVPEKGCREAFNILARLPESCHVVFCGEGPEHGSLEAEARTRGMMHRAHFPGFLKDPRVAYGAIDGLLFLSLIEPFGLVLAEAMAAGIPIFGLAGQGGYREPQLPLLTPDNSILLDRALGQSAYAELAEKIREFRENPAAIQQRTARARGWVRQHFDVTRYIREIVACYRHVLNPF